MDVATNWFGTTRSVRAGYGTVLCLICVSFVFLAAAPTTDWATFVGVALQGATVLLALLVAGARRRLLVAAEIVVVLSLAGAAAVLLSADGRPSSSSFILTALLAAVAPLVIGFGVVRDLRVERRVTAQVVMGALCIYLLLGMVFAAIYGAIGRIDPDGLFVNVTDSTVQEHLYFSFVTMTTLGYGDLSPAEPLSRTVAMVEALLGQLYLVTVIALLVGNLGRTALRERPDSSSG